MFDVRTYWEHRYRVGGSSGAGSAGAEAAFKVGLLVRVARMFAVKSVFDMGVGDGEIAARFLDSLPGVSYVGVDFAEAALKRCRTRVGSRPEVTLRLADITREGAGESADLVACLDVLFHIPTDAQAEQAVRHICSCARRVAVLSAWNMAPEPKLAAHCFFRPLVFPCEVRLIEEVVVPCNSVKSLYVVTPRRHCNE